MKRSELTGTVLLLPLDILALVSAFLLAFFIRDQFVPVVPGDLGFLADRLNYTGTDISLTFDRYARYLWVIIPLMLGSFAVTGLYRLRNRASWLSRVITIALGVSVGEFAILFLFLLRRSFFLPRSVVIYSWILAIVFVVILRVAVSLVQGYLYGRGIGVITIALVGRNSVAQSMADRLSGNWLDGYRIVRYPDIPGATELRKRLTADQIDEVLVITDHYDTAKLVELRNCCLELHKSFNLVPPLLAELQSTAEVRTIGRLPVIEVRPTPLEGWGRVVKRAYDLLASSFFIIAFSPLLAVIAGLIYASSPGPIIYKHRRIGRSGLPIDVWKFRTLKWEFCTGVGDADQLFKQLLDANPAMKKEWEETFKLKNDPRVHWIGRILRRTSLDELPQFFNVLGGSLSLVGPRPIVPAEQAKYGEQARILFSVKPGLTGLWQVSGRNDVSYDERVALDTHYIEHWSLLTDLSITVRTGIYVIATILGKGSGGAY